MTLSWPEYLAARRLCSTSQRSTGDPRSIAEGDKADAILAALDRVQEAGQQHRLIVGTPGLAAHILHRTANPRAGPRPDHKPDWLVVGVNVNNSFTFNTVVSPILANNIVTYGGRDIKITDNVVTDTVVPG